MIRGLITDLTGPVIAPDPPVEEQYLQVYRDLFPDRAGLPPSRVRDRFRTSFHSIDVPEGELRYGTTRIEGFWFWKRVVQSVFPRLKPGEVIQLTERLFERFSEPSSWSISDDVVDVVDRLRCEGITTVLVTNWDVRGPQLLRNLEIDDCFDSRVFSCEVGIEKPDRRIFDVALERSGLDADESVMVGDSIEQDLRPAHEIGMTTFYYGTNDHELPGYVDDSIRSWSQIDEVLNV